MTLIQLGYVCEHVEGDADIALFLAKLEFPDWRQTVARKYL